MMGVEFDNTPLQPVTVSDADGVGHTFDFRSMLVLFDRRKQEESTILVARHQALQLLEPVVHEHERGVGGGGGFEHQETTVLGHVVRL